MQTTLRPIAKTQNEDKVVIGERGDEKEKE